MVILTALSRGAGGGAGFLAAGRLVGGAGGVGLALMMGCKAPFAVVWGVGMECWVGAGGGGGGCGARVVDTSSLRYADGAQPWPEPSTLLASHQPGWFGVSIWNA